jgi:hypothetical protein
MIPIIVTLVITMIVDGRDFERHEPMPSIEECWTKARTTMEEIRASEHKEIDIRQIGVGCVIDAGDPA